VSLVLEEHGYKSVQFSEIMELVERYGTLRAARSRAQRFADVARGCLEGFADSQFKDALRSLPDFVVERES